MISLEEEKSLCLMIILKAECVCVWGGGGGGIFTKLRMNETFKVTDKE